MGLPYIESTCDYNIEFRERRWCIQTRKISVFTLSVKFSNWFLHWYPSEYAWRRNHCSRARQNSVVTSMTLIVNLKVQWQWSDTKVIWVYSIQRSLNWCTLGWVIALGIKLHCPHRAATFFLSWKGLRTRFTGKFVSKFVSLFQLAVPSPRRVAPYAAE